MTTEAEAIVSQTQTEIKLLEENVTKSKQKFDEITATIAVIKQKVFYILFQIKDHNNVMDKMKQEQQDIQRKYDDSKKEYDRLKENEKILEQNCRVSKSNVFFNY